jgi:hypothetical protein
LRPTSAADLISLTQNAASHFGPVFDPTTAGTKKQATRLGSWQESVAFSDGSPNFHPNKLAIA